MLLREVPEGQVCQTSHGRKLQVVGHHGSKSTIRTLDNGKEAEVTNGYEVQLVEGIVKETPYGVKAHELKQLLRVGCTVGEAHSRLAQKFGDGKGLKDYICNTIYWWKRKGYVRRKDGRWCWVVNQGDNLQPVQ